jgi:adenylosuccinate synthase
MLNHLSSIYLTGLDLLDELDEIKICKKYKIGETEVEGIHPTLIEDFGKLSPVYKTMPGWKKDITKVEKFDDLPVNCQSFVAEIEKSTKVQIKYLSVSAEEEEGLLRIIR